MLRDIIQVIKKNNKLFSSFISMIKKKKKNK